MEPKASLLCLQKGGTGPYSESGESILKTEKHIIMEINTIIILNYCD